MKPQFIQLNSIRCGSLLCCYVFLITLLIISILIIHNLCQTFYTLTLRSTVFSSFKIFIYIFKLFYSTVCCFAPIDHRKFIVCENLCDKKNKNTILIMIIRPKNNHCVVTCTLKSFIKVKTVLFKYFVGKVNKPSENNLRIIGYWRKSLKVF